MQVTSTTLSLTVDDVAASRDFLVDHFGYRERVVAEGFVSLAVTMPPSTSCCCGEGSRCYPRVCATNPRPA